MNFFSRPKKRIYLDHAAATPLDPEVKQIMVKTLSETYGNPSAIHEEGEKARQLIENARQSVATTFGIRPVGVIFTSGGTESNNLAILGFIKKLHRIENRSYTDMEIVTTRIEHPSIMMILPILAATGVTIKFAEVDEEGKINVSALEAVLSPKTVLVTFAYANSEVGVVQPVGRLVRTIRKYEKEKKIKIAVHVDAAQAPLWLPCALPRIGVDMMSLDAGKCGGPKGVGVLAVQGNVSLLPILYGGGQEQGLRPGTENVVNIVGAAKAFESAQVNNEARSQKVSAVRDNFIQELLVVFPKALLNGPKGDERLANNINFSLPGLDTEYAVVYLDHHGIAASTKSACSGAGGGESKVVFVMTEDKARAAATIRLSLGEAVTDQEMKQVLKILTQYQQKMLTLT